MRTTAALAALCLPSLCAAFGVARSGARGFTSAARARGGRTRSLAMELDTAQQPDASDFGPLVEKYLEAKFKLLGEALEILGDEMRRKLYNEGYDKAAIEERVQAAARAANDHSKDGCNRGGCGGCHH